MSTVRLLDLTLERPEENLALDEALLLDLDESARAPEARRQAAETLRFWESPVYFVVLGVAARLRDDVEVEACAGAGVPIQRRASGGGTVLQGPGCLNFSLVLSLDARPELRDVRGSYAAILGRVRETLGLERVELSGTSDLALEGRKISGNAQKRTRRALLHQGTVLHGLDAGLLARFLREPEKQPAYRNRRTHAAFVMNTPLPAPEIKRRLAAAWGATPPGPSFQLPPIDGLVTEKYSSKAWVERF